MQGVRPRSYAILNAVKREKLKQVLVRVVEKMAANEPEVFTSSEKEQLVLLLGLESAQIDEVVHVIMEIFHDAATFGQIDWNLLLSRGVDDKVAQVVEKSWKKKGLPVAEQIVASLGFVTPSLELQQTDWRLYLEMGSCKQSEQLHPAAIFQLTVADKGLSPNETEKLDIELSHADLRSLFLQLNAIQEEIDTPLTSPTA